MTWRITSAPNAGVIRLLPKADAPVLTTLEPGKTVLIYSEPQKGFYGISLNPPINKAKIGWISASAIPHSSKTQRAPAGITPVVNPLLPPSPFSITPNLGVTYLQYSQPRIQPLTEQTLTLKVSSQYTLNDHWNFSGVANFSGLPSFTSQAGVSFLLLSGDMRIAYQFLPASAAWRISLVAGWYYLTSFSIPASFGFQNIQGPELFPSISWKMSQFSTLSVFVKYSPVVSAFTVLPLSSAEIAMGLGFAIKTSERGNAIEFTLDASRLNVNLNGLGTSQVSTYTFGVGYRL